MKAAKMWNYTNVGRNNTRMQNFTAKARMRTVAVVVDDVEPLGILVNPYDGKR